jgi:hypothetical protein
MGRKRYERRWMLDYVDAPLLVDATYTREKLRWEPETGRSILRQLPTLMQKFSNHRPEWTQHNIRRNEGIYEYIEDMIR